MTFRVKARLIMQHPQLKVINKPTKKSPTPCGKRNIYFGSLGWYLTPIFHRGELSYDHRVPGPVVVEESTSTTVVYPKQILEVDRYLNLLVRMAE